MLQAERCQVLKTQSRAANPYKETSETSAEQCCRRPLTKGLPQEGWSGAGRLVDADVVDRRPGQGHADPHQRVDGVTVERNHHQEDAADAVDYREKQGELQENGETGLRVVIGRT